MVKKCQNPKKKILLRFSIFIVLFVFIFFFYRFKNTIDLIKDLKPHIVVKGGEWTAEEVRKRDEIPHDIEVYIYPFKDGYSSTNIINMIKEK